MRRTSGNLKDNANPGKAANASDKSCLHFSLSIIQLAFSGRKWGFGMAKAIGICALCIICAAVGATVDHYFGAGIEQGVVELFSGPQLQQAVSPKAAVAAPTDVNVEVLGDRVKCDVRYQELKIATDKYQSFKRKCMGPNWDGD